jgi:3-hydroxyacyl-CoA dehydrogenase/enoyl-CoA hydratase/3-hydroxybutyryl-CoA epimerase
MRRAGRLGRKASHGFYRYGSGRPTPDPPGEILAGTVRGGSAGDRGAYGVTGAAASHATGGATVGPDEIVDRCVLLLLNEACYALQEKIVASPSELDLAIVMGTGFAPFRGGILRHAEAIGVSALQDRMGELAERYGSRFEPAPLLRDVAETSGSFFA